MATEMNVIVDKIVIDDSGAVSGARGVESAYDRLSAAAGSAAGDIESGNNALVALSKAAGTAVGEMGRITAASAQLAAATADLAADVVTAERAWMALDVAVAVSRDGVLGLRRELVETTVETKLFAEEADAASRAWSTLTKAAGAIGVSLSIGGLMQQAQEYQRAQALIQRAAGDSADSVERSLYRIAQASGASFTELSGLTKALDELPGGMRESLGVVEAVSLAMAQMPGDAQSAEAAITQFTQAMQSGKLRGDEFNSMMEQAPALADALARGIGTTRGELRAMAEAGELSAGRVSAALRAMLPELREVNQEIERTLSQSVQNVENALTVFAGRVDQRAGGSSVIRDTMGDVTQQLESLEAQNAAVAVMERFAVAGGLASDAVMVLADNIDLLIGAWAVWQATKAVAGMELFRRSVITGNVAMRGLAGTVNTAAPAIQASLAATGMSADKAAASVQRLQATINSTFTRGAGAAGLAASFGVNPLSALMLAVQAAGAAWLLYESRVTDAQAASEALARASEATRDTLAGEATSVEELAERYAELSAQQQEVARTTASNKMADAAKNISSALGDIRADLGNIGFEVRNAMDAIGQGDAFRTAIDRFKEVSAETAMADEAAVALLMTLRQMADGAAPEVAGILNEMADQLGVHIPRLQEAGTAYDKLRAEVALANGDLETARELWPELASGIREAGSAADGTSEKLQKTWQEVARLQLLADAARAGGVAAMEDAERGLEASALAEDAGIHENIARALLERRDALKAYLDTLTEAPKPTRDLSEATYTFADALAETEKELDALQARAADTIAGMELENEALRLQIEGREEQAAWLQEEARLRDQLDPMYDKHADQLRALWEEERRLNREAAAKDDAIRAWENYAREVERVAGDVSSDVADLFWDGLTGEAKAQDALDFFKNWARRLGTEMLQQQIILPITTQIVGSMPGLFGVSRPSGAMAQAGAGGGAGGGVVGMASSLGGLGSLFGGGESVMGSIGSWIATSSLGQSLGLSAVQASAPGSVAAFGGIGQAVAGANATLTGAGEALVGGLNASPWGMIGSLGANLLGLGGGIGGSIGGMVGSVAGGALGSSMGTILGLAGGPVGAVIGGFLGSSLGGLFGGGKPKHPAGHAYVGPDGEVTRAASKHMGTGSLEVVARAALDSLNDAAAKVFGDGTRLQSGEVMAQFDNGTYALSNVQGSSFDEALPGFILKGLKQADLGTFSEDITLARKNSQAKTLDEFVSDIGFARSYRDEAEYMGPVVTPEAQGVLAAREEIAGLNQQFGVMREKVRELGLDMAPLEDAWEAQLRAMIGIGEMPEDLSPAERAVRQLRARMEELAPALTAAGIAAEEQTQALNKQLADMRQGFDQGLERTILEMTNPEEAARQDELARYETQLRDARALGADLENVHELHRLRMLEIDEQYNAEQMQAAEASVSRVRQLADGLRQYVAGMGTSDLSPYGAEQRLQESGGLYWQTLASARGGDVGAVERLQDVSNSYLQQAQGYYGNASQQYAQIFQTTRAQLSSVVGNIDAAFGRSIERINFEPVTSGLNDVNTTLRQGQQASAQQTLMLRSELAALRAEVADLKSELARANAA